MSYVLLLHKHYIAVLVSPTPFPICNKTTKCVYDVFSIFPIQTRSLSPTSVCEGAGRLTHTRLLHACNTHTEMAERTRPEVWLHFTRLDVDNARCQKYNKRSAGTSNLSKHLAKVLHIQTEKCTVFDCLSSSSVAPSTSNFSTSGILCKPQSSSRYLRDLISAQLYVGSHELRNHLVFEIKM